MHTLKAVGVALVAALSITLACSSNESTDGTGGNAGAAAGTGGLSAGSGGNAGVAGSGPVTTCEAYGSACQVDSECCSLKCNDKTCEAGVDVCTKAGGECEVATDCCTLRCEDGSCSGSACVRDGSECTAGAECCSGKCDGTCQSLNEACATAGNACDNSQACCSGLCIEGTCQLGASFCIQAGDVCAAGADCCSGICNVVDGDPLGLCAEPPSAPTNCGGVHGTICNGCGECCSRLCAPYGPTGVTICQPASGCRVNGELCREDKDCCGGDPRSGLPGAGTVACAKADPADTLGRCRNPTAPDEGGNSCNPQGNVCHYTATDYVCEGSSAARANCCAEQGVKKQDLCQLDGLGVPRCAGLAQCRDAGETCASAADCCNDVPCIPDPGGSGQLICAESGVECVETGGTCTTNADCCVGTTCLIEVGESQGVCGNEQPPPDGTPSCAEYGQLCSDSDDCCNLVPCSGGVCRYVIK